MKGKEQRRKNLKQNPKMTQGTQQTELNTSTTINVKSVGV
jgi:hypothetical protein